MMDYSVIMTAFDCSKKLRQNESACLFPQPLAAFGHILLEIKEVLALEVLHRDIDLILAHLPRGALLKPAIIATGQQFNDIRMIQIAHNLHFFLDGSQSLFTQPFDIFSFKYLEGKHLSGIICILY